MNERPYTHTEHFPVGALPAWEAVYWRGNSAVTSDPADKADRVVLNFYVSGSGYHRAAEYSLPFERQKFEDHLRSMKAAWEAGREARSDEILALLGGGT